MNLSTRSFDRPCPAIKRQVSFIKGLLYPNPGFEMVMCQMVVAYQRPPNHSLEPTALRAAAQLGAVMRCVASRTRSGARVLCRVKAQRLVVNARGVVFTGGWFCAAVRAWRGHAAGCVDFAPSASRITSASSRPPSARARACHLVSVLGVAGCGTLRGAAAAYPRAVSPPTLHGLL
jgi:hypothetical protein